MKILKTKQEKKEDAKQKAELIVSEISTKVEQYGSVEVVFDREDFKKELENPLGVSDQDMKRKYRVAIDKLQKTYKVKAIPDMSGGVHNFKLRFTFSKKKEKE